MELRDVIQGSDSGNNDHTQGLDSIRVAQESSPDQKWDAEAARIANQLRQDLEKPGWGNGQLEQYEQKHPDDPQTDSVDDWLHYIAASNSGTLRAVDTISQALYDRNIDSQLFDHTLQQFKCNPEQFHYFCHLLHLESLARGHRPGTIYDALTDTNPFDQGHYMSLTKKQQYPKTLTITPFPTDQPVYKFTTDGCVIS